jgi:rare lipoprotein A
MRGLTWCLCAFLLCAACSAPDDRSSGVPDTDRVLESREGLASYMATLLDGRQTASGAPFDTNALVAAHPTYPFGTVVRVTNLTNNKTVDVRVVDRGPVAHVRDEGVIIDVSKAAATALAFVKEGRTKVRTEVMRWGPSEGR